MRLILVLFMFLLTSVALAQATLSYSGRLVNLNGSPVTGPVNLKFDLAYTNQIGVILCTQDLNGVDLVNGVFHVSLAFPSCNLSSVLANTPDGESASIRITDLTPNPDRVYSFQAIHSVPFAIVAQKSKQLDLAGTADGQVLTWSGGQWTAADPASTTNGTVTSITATEGLSGGVITDTGVIGISDGGVTSQKIADSTIVDADISPTAQIDQSKIKDLPLVLAGKEPLISSGASTQYLDGNKAWQDFNQAVRNTFLLGYAVIPTPASVAPTDTIMEAIGKLEGQIIANDTAFDSTGQWEKDGSLIYYNSGNVGIGTNNPSNPLTIEGTNFINQGILLRNKETPASSNYPAIAIENFAASTSGHPFIALKNSGGSSAAPSATTINSSLGAIIGYAHNGTNFVQGGRLDYRLRGTPGATYAETDFSISLGDASNGQAERLVVKGSTGNVGIGTITPRSKLEVGGGVQIGNDIATCDPTKPGTLRYNSGNVEFCNGSSWQAFGVSGAGLTSLNGSNSSTQNFAIGTSGTAPQWSTAGGVHTINIPLASASSVTAGLISKSDYDAFNTKLGTSTSFTGDVSGNYNSTSVDKIKGTPLVMSALTTNNFLKFNGTNWVNSMLGASDITSGVLPVSRGGTNTSSLSGNRLMVSTPTAITEAAALTNGQLLIGSTGGAPVAANLTQGTGVTITNSAGGITISATGSGGTVTSVTGTAPITVSASTTVPNVSMAKATTSVDGYLSSTDWNIFNNKQNSLASGATINGIVYPATSSDTLQIPLAPVNLTDATNKQYVDTRVATAANQWTESAGNVYRSSGNVGVGISAPSEKLHVVGNGLIRSNNTTFKVQESNHALGSAEIQIGQSDWYGFLKYDTATDVFSIDTGLNGVATGTGGIHIKHTSGNVGIGTSAPASVLHVEAADNSALRVTRNNVQSALLGDLGSTDHGQLNLYNSSGTIGVLISSAQNSFFNGGNVGIGTASPSHPLNIVHGAIDSTGDIVLETFNPGIQLKDRSTTPDSGDFRIHVNRASGSVPTVMTVSADVASDGTYEKDIISLTDVGNVGIGTATPSEKLTIKDGALSFVPQDVAFSNMYRTPASFGETFRIFLQNDQDYGNPFGTNNNNAIIFENQDNNNPDPDDGMYFVNTGSDGVPQVAMAIKGNGNVGVGTIAPAQKLSVAGVIESTSGGVKYPDGTVQTTAANSGMKIQKGTIGACTSGSAGSSGAVTFPTAFTGNPIVQLTVVELDNSGCTSARIRAISTTGFSWVSYVGGTVTACDCIYWTAFD